MKLKLNDSSVSKFKLDDNGFLRKDVNLGRLGPMEYFGSEIGSSVKDLKPNEIYDVHTTKEALFNEQTIKSFENVPVTMDHPDNQDVTVENWKDVAIGHVTNVRVDDDHLKGTVIINDKNAISLIQEGKREVSLGYDADIVLKDGILVKENIVGNHLAVVEEGRCGETCKINDKKGGKFMAGVNSLAKLLGIKKKGQPKNPKKMKIGDSKLKDRKKKFGDASANFNAKLKDAEEVLASEDATDEEKLQAVQELQEEATQLQEEATQALDEATQATEQATELAEQVEPREDDENTNNDADIVAGEAQDKIEELEATLAERDEEIAQLKSRLEELEETETKKTVANDVKTVFPNLKFKDSATARDRKRQVLVSVGSHTVDSVKKLTDCALDSAYQATLATARVRNVKSNNVGRSLNDNKASKMSVSQRFGGSK